jgi:hypothetical protein
VCYANGRGFVPNVRRDLYEKLIAAAGGEPSQDTETPRVTQGLPLSWDEIAPGHLVIAFENKEEGWWEAIVVARDGDMLTLRWRDYPKQSKVVRHRTGVALLNPVGFTEPCASRVISVGAPTCRYQIDGPKEQICRYLGFLSSHPADSRNRPHGQLPGQT